MHALTFLTALPSPKESNTQLLSRWWRTCSVVSVTSAVFVITCARSASPRYSERLPSFKDAYGERKTQFRKTSFHADGACVRKKCDGGIDRQPAKRKIKKRNYLLQMNSAAEEGESGIRYACLCVLGGTGCEHVQTARTPFLLLLVLSVAGMCFLGGSGEAERERDEGEKLIALRKRRRVFTKRMRRGEWCVFVHVCVCVFGRVREDGERGA